jgi:capsular polysaccharide biosynthesis protein
VSNPSDTRILYITITSSDPELASAISNEFATVARKYIYEKMATEEPNIMSVALVPKNPVSPNKTRNIILGFLLGGFIAAGAITVIFLLDDRIKTADDLARYAGIPTLAVVPLVEKGNEQKPGQKTTQRRRQE